MKTLLCLLTAAVLLCGIPSIAQEAIPVKNGDLQIPSSWRLVTVTKDVEIGGLKGYTLWFQDATNSVWAITNSRDLAGKYQTTREITKFSSTTNSVPQLAAPK